MSGAHNRSDQLGSNADTATSLTALRADFPHFRIWREIVPGRARYIARRLDPGPGLHAVVTDDLTELREALNGETARPANITAQSSVKATGTPVLRGQ